MKQITVLLADDYAIEREAFRKMISREADLQVVGEAQNGRQAVTLAKILRPDVILMDITMPRLNGLEATRQISKALPGVKVLMIAARSDYGIVQNAVACGVAGFLLKHISAREVCRAIRDVQRGIAVFDPAVYRCFDHFNLPSQARPGLFPSIDQLSSREMEVLQLIAEGNANKQIAAELGISLKTVEKHRQLLMEKLDIHNTAGLTRYAVCSGIIESAVHIRELETGTHSPVPALVPGVNELNFAGENNRRLPMAANPCRRPELYLSIYDK